MLEIPLLPFKLLWWAYVWRRRFGDPWRYCFRASWAITCVRFLLALPWYRRGYEKAMGLRP
jgi:hypothetical protein